MPPVRFRYQTVEFGTDDFHLRTLRDTQQCPDDLVDNPDDGISSANWGLFGVLWSSEVFLSDMMLNEKIGNRKILEVGCGIGLASIVLKHRGADITALDHHPSAAAFLNINTALNDLEPIQCECIDWQNLSPEFGLFDFIIASDILYDHHTVTALVEFLVRHTTKNAHALIVDPCRGLSASFLRQSRARGFTATSESVEFPLNTPDSDKYKVLRLQRLG